MLTENSHSPFPFRAYFLTALFAGLWINISEVFRYFAFVMPMLREAHPLIEGVAPMNFGVFAVWGLWDTILVLAFTGFIWIFCDRFGARLSTLLAGTTFFWASVFVILWVGLFNMRLAPMSVLYIALPLAWIELIVAALIIRWGRSKFQ